MSVYTKLACFAGGALFGSFGIKLLSSKDAKKAYVHVTAAGLRMKDSVMGTVTTVQEHAAGILASAAIHAYAPAPAAGRRMKDAVMGTVTTVL